MNRFGRPAPLPPRVVECRQRHAPPVLTLVARGRVIGRYNSWQRRWDIQRPSPLLIDEAKLPVPF